jgi:hypothetical protein
MFVFQPRILAALVGLLLKGEFMITVHHLAHSQSERIVWLCEEVALPYKFIRYEREPS